jgi:hypothetical protein
MAIIDVLDSVSTMHKLKGAKAPSGASRPGQQGRQRS